MKGVYVVWTIVTQTMALEPAAVSVVSLVEMQIHWRHFSSPNQNLRDGAQDAVH